jgi:hypothetical protein
VTDQALAIGLAEKIAQEPEIDRAVKIDPAARTGQEVKIDPAARMGQAVKIAPASPTVQALAIGRAPAIDKSGAKTWPQTAPTESRTASSGRIIASSGGTRFATRSRTTTHCSIFGTIIPAGPPGG